MKKFIILILLALSGCDFFENNTTQQLDRLKRESIQFCSCRKGLDYFISSLNRVDFGCVDGTALKIIGVYDTMVISGCK